MPSSNPRRSGNPSVRAGATPPGAGSPTRLSVAERSRGVLVKMARLPTLVIPGLMLVLMLVGLSAPLVFALPALALIGAFVGWLAYISWPVLDTKGRLTRGLVVGLVVGSALARVQGWL